MTARPAEQSMAAPVPLPRRLLGVLLKTLLASCAALCAFALLEGLASLWIAADEAQLVVVLPEQSHSRYDELLGWAHEPGAHVADIYGPGRSITINSQGLRALEEYTSEVPAGRFRVVCLGDSFTMGFGVDDHDTFAAQLQALCPTIQAVNMGMGGYGLGQDMLWYERDGDALAADLLVFAFIDADFYRTELSEFVGYPKPAIEVRDGEMLVTNVPVPRVFGRASFGRRLHNFVEKTALSKLLAGDDEPAPETEADDDAAVTMFDRAEHILDAVVELARRRHQRPMLLYLPTKKLVYFKQRSSISRWVADYAGRRSVLYLDLQPAFSDFTPAELIEEIYLPDNHFGVRGNGIIAERLLETIASRLPDFPGCDGPR
ncbi:MAG: SGNH/GDSL hydrolase family protein [Planctomycetes bacterium]|nr:SGNH/GDSL hydrolase family protein [Planctomycetota bacterium]